MKIKKLLTFGITLFVLVNCSPSEATPKSDLVHKASYIHVRDLTCNGIYGPYTRDDGTIRLDFTCYCDSNNTKEVVKIREINSTTFFYSHNSYYHDHDYDYEWTQFTIYIPLDETLTDRGIEVFIIISDYYSNEVLTSSSFLLYPKTKHYVNTLYQKEYIASGCLFNVPYTPESDYLRERFYFNNVPATFSNPDYFTLPLDNFYFVYYHLGHDFTYQEAYLTCDDPHNLFPYVKSNGSVKIPLKLRVSGNCIYIDYKDTMYVDTTNLTMSLVGRVGYSSTNLFYMPRGKNKELDETTFYIKIISAGIHDTDITIPVTYYSLNNRFGSCDDSEYCIKGEIIE